MADIQLFTNKPKFCQKPLTTSEILTLPVINMNLGPNNDPNNLALCGDPNLGTLLVKNIVHKNIRCGGSPIDLNFMQDLFPMKTRIVDTKRWFNHYVCDMDLNLYVANSITGTAPAAPTWVQILKSNHGQNGAYSLPAIGYQWFDKENQIQYTVTDVDTTVPYAHRAELTPNDENVTVSVKANVAYIIGQARMVGGCNCPELSNALSSIGYTQEVHPLRVRRDWRLCVDVLTGFPDKFQFAIIYDTQGNPMDAFDVYEAQQMREGIRMTLNMASFIGTPTTNASLISGVGATIDSNHTGFYGLLPVLKYGGGNVYDIQDSEGFDWEVDGEPIMLYQDSRKRTKRFMVIHGAMWGTNMVDRTNKLVSRTNVGKNIWEAYKRLGTMTGEDYEAEVVKLGINFYQYMGFHFDLKKVDSWSDYRFMGNDNFNNMAIFVPQDGVSENGQALQPVEFYTYGVGQWTGEYEEHYIDYRVTDGCNDIGGWGAESLAMAVHCPDQFVLVNPVKAA